MAFADWSLEGSEEAGYQAIYTPRKSILEDITRTVDARGCVSIGRKYKGKILHIIVTEEK
jgi:hypothetical protein